MTKKRKCLLVAVFVLLMMALALFYIWFRLPKSGKVVYSKKLASPTLTYPKRLFLDTMYFSCDYPGNFEIKTHGSQESGSATLESVVLVSRDIIPKKIAISVEDVDGRSYEDLSSVKYRQISPSLYDESTLRISGVEGLLYVKQDVSSEKTVFFMTNNHLHTISVTSSQLGDASVDEYFEIITRRFKTK